MRRQGRADVSDTRDVLASGRAAPSVTVARACPTFESADIQDLDAAAADLDDSVCLERPSDGRHGRPLHAKHAGKALLRDGKRMVASTVMRL